MSGTMTPYIVRQGDYLAKLAFVHGFDADEVWNDPKNEEIKKLRPDPSILAPGDIVYIPEKQTGDALPIAKGTDNNYAATVPKVDVCIAWQGADDQPMANERYEIKGLGGADPDLKEEGTTDGEGKLQLAVPVDVREVSIYFPAQHCAYQLRVGEMDPIDEATGVRKRLRHLGFGDERLCKDVDDAEVLRDALASFQEAHGKDSTGDLDAETQRALLSAHGI